MEVLQKWLREECNQDYSLGELKNLEWLDLSENNITSIPKEFGELKKLEWLDLDYNNLTSLPKEFGELKNLELLYLDSNNLTINKKDKELIKFLDKHRIEYKLADDSLITDILI